MGTVGDDLDTVQDKLHDDGALWTRAELLDWYNSGYRELLALSQAFSRLLPLDVPGRHAYAVCYPWETRHTSQGTWWLPLLACYGGARQATNLWEVEHLDGVTPNAALVGITSQWERSHTGATDRHFMFGLPRGHEFVRRFEWNDKVLLPASVREFDEVDDGWMRRAGDPSWWTVGVGTVRSVEVYEIDTTYQQAYQLVNALTGIPRHLSGSRTYSTEVDAYNATNLFAYSSQGDKDALVKAETVLLSGMGYRFTQEPDDKTNGFYVFTWEGLHLNGDTDDEDQTEGEFIGMFPWEEVHGADRITFALGGIRSVTSPDRQYVPMVAEAASQALLGGIRDWRSSEDNLMALEVMVPYTDLAETDAPVLIPSPLQKYLRYYTLSRAFGREGEGHNPDMAEHYNQRFLRGTRLFQRLGDSSHADRTFRRQDELRDAGRVPLVRLPSEFERVW